MTAIPSLVYMAVATLPQHNQIHSRSLPRRQPLIGFKVFGWLCSLHQGGGFVRAVRCLGKVQTEIAFFVSLLVVWCSPIIYRLRSVLFGSKLPKSAVRGVSFKFARAVLFGFLRSRCSGFRPQRHSLRFARVRLQLAYKTIPVQNACFRDVRGAERCGNTGFIDQLALKGG